MADHDTVTLVIKNADGMTPDCTLTEMQLDGTTVGCVKAKVREEYAGNPAVSRMKIVFSGRSKTFDHP